MEREHRGTEEGSDVMVPSGGARVAAEEARMATGEGKNGTSRGDDLVGGRNIGRGAWWRSGSGDRLPVLGEERNDGTGEGEGQN